MTDRADAARLRRVVRRLCSEHPRRSSSNPVAVEEALEFDRMAQVVDGVAAAVEDLATGLTRTVAGARGSLRSRLRFLGRLLVRT